MEKHPLFLWLKKERMPRKKFAGKFSITPYYVYLILKGKRWPSYKLASKISDFTGISIEALLSFGRNS